MPWRSGNMQLCSNLNNQYKSPTERSRNKYYKKSWHKIWKLDNADEPLITDLASQNDHIMYNIDIAV